jgi:hypothetical protein
MRVSSVILFHSTKNLLIEREIEEEFKLAK